MEAVNTDISIRIKWGKHFYWEPSEEKFQEEMTMYLNLHRAIEDVMDGERPNESFLTSLRQIAGFYWYCEANGSNHNFKDRAEHVVSRYGLNSGRKAVEKYNEFHIKAERVKDTTKNIDDLRAICNEARRMGYPLTDPSPLEDLEEATSTNKFR